MSFACLGTLQIPSPCKLFATACCPDKDLVILVSRLAGQDRLSLWNYSQGTKIWEVNLGGNEGEVVEVVDLAWSPDGQCIAIAQKPPLVTLHSVQDGSKSLCLTLEGHNGFPVNDVTGIWWLSDAKEASGGTVPDVFRRGNIITGSAESICRGLPRLERFQTEASKVTATDLFAFQGSQTKTPSKIPDLPDFIEKWPVFSKALYLDGLFGGPSDTKPVAGDGDGVVDDPNRNSLLLVAEEHGLLRVFLDGSFPLGAIPLGSDTATFVSRDLQRPILSVHSRRLYQGNNSTKTSLNPTLIHLPTLAGRKPRDFGQLSTLSKELVSYIIRVIKDVKSTWYGSDSTTGARELGPNWLNSLEGRQRNQFGQQEPDAILDLTALLVTGRATDSLLDFLGSSEHMSERGIRKWEITMVEALVKIREYCEYRVSPACQRLYLIMEELDGWSSLPQFSAFQLRKADLKECLLLTREILTQIASLTSFVRRELDWFKEFINWLKFETQAANPSTESPPQPRHDVLEVNNYLTFSLKFNSIDKWFEGLLPEDANLFSTPSGVDSVLSGALQRAHSALGPLQQAAGVQNERPVTNLDALAHRLAFVTKDIFDTGAGATCRSARLFSPDNSTSTVAPDPVDQESIDRRLTPREHIVGHTRYLLLPIDELEQSCLCVARIQNADKTQAQNNQAAVALVGTALHDGEMVIESHFLDADFFDDHTLIAVYQTGSQNAPTIGVMNYDELEFYSIKLDSSSSTQEDLVAITIALMEAGKVPRLEEAFKQTQELKGLKGGPVSLALNGRVGRRVACVLDGQGTTLQSFDMEWTPESADDSEEEE